MNLSFAHAHVGLPASLVLLAMYSHVAFAADKGTGHVDPRGIAFLKLELRLERSHRGTSDILPGGCAWLAHERVCVPKVTVDGRRLSALSVMSGDVYEATKPFGRPLPLQSQRAIRAGIAIGVFNDLVSFAAIRDHITVTMREARSFALQELRMYRRSPPRSGMQSPVPAGMTPKQFFTSARTVAAYRHEMVIGRERDRIIREYPGLSQNGAMQRWFRTIFPTHTVRVNGRAPGFSIPDAYSAV